jgi:hypothetical protein
MPDQASQEMGVAAIVAELMYLRQQGHALSADDAAVLDILDTLSVRSNKLSNYRKVFTIRWY